MPSLAMILLTASRKPDSARLDSTWARVERVIRGYLLVVSDILEAIWKGNSHVKAIDRMPPPAPLTAWAMLSDCCAAVDEAMIVT